MASAGHSAFSKAFGCVGLLDRVTLHGEPHKLPSQPNHIFLIVRLWVQNRQPGGIGLCPNLYLNHQAGACYASLHCLSSLLVPIPESKYIAIGIT